LAAEVNQRSATARCR